MTQEEKDLLLKDLCARLPYGVKIAMPGLWDSSKITIEPLNEIFKGDDGLFRANGNGHCIEYIKPYLFPLSSMTEEQREEYHDLCDSALTEWGNPIWFDSIESIGWLNAHHFDIYGLIPMGLAEDATGKNIY